MNIPDRSQIKEAQSKIAPYVRRTPVLFDDAVWGGGGLEFKFEHLQLTGSFKARGAFFTMLSSDVPTVGFVAASGGNHGAAVAYAAKTLGHRAKVFVPELAGPAKIALIKDAGADLTVVPGAYQDAADAAKAYEAETGAMQIHPYDAPMTVAGQGTVMAEWEDQGLIADTILIAVGGGGLIAGSMAWLDGARKIVAVEPELAPTLHRSLSEGPDATVAVSGVAANALGAAKIGRICYDLAKSQGIETVTVPDPAISDAQKLIWSTLRQVVEPAGATALAALTSGQYVPEKDERVAVLLCGANPTDPPIR